MDKINLNKDNNDGFNNYDFNNNGFNNNGSNGDFQPNNNGENQKDQSNLCKILGIASIPTCFIGWFCCIGYVGVGLSIAAIIMAIMSKNNNGGVLNSDAKIGLITGIAGIVVLILGVIIGFILGLAMGLSGY